MKHLIILVALSVFPIVALAQTNGGNSFARSKYDFVAASMSGEKVDTAALRGKVVVLNLWYIHCPICVGEITLLNEVVNDHKANSDVVFLAPAATPKADLQKFLVKNPFSYTVIPDAMGLILAKFGKADRDGDLSVPFPMHYVFDREGKLVVEAQGIKGVQVVKDELKRQFPAAPSK